MYICQHKVQFVLAFVKNDRTLVEISIVLWACQFKLGFVQVNTKSAWKMADVRLLYI